MAQAPRKTSGTRRSRSSDEEDKPQGRTRGRDLAPQKGSRAVTDYEKRMAEEAEKAANMERGAPMGRSFSFKGGQMVFDGAPVKDNEVVVIIAGAVIAKAFYEGAIVAGYPSNATDLAVLKNVKAVGYKN